VASGAFMPAESNADSFNPDNVGALPDDPLQMPPPHWRGGGATFQVLDAFHDLLNLLEDLPDLNDETSLKVSDHFDKYPGEEESSTDQAMDEFSEICDPLWELEHRIKLKTQLVILMTAIASEELINRFCVYNLPKELTETLERLSPAEKLTAGASSLGHTHVRGSAAFSAVTDLSSWRNAFAHGHCNDRPLKTLRHNHLISPEMYPGVPDSIGSMLNLVPGYFRISKYLSTISRNSYTKGDDGNMALVPGYIEEVEEFEFTVDGELYEVQRRQPPNP
jgi:hypothetical protein